MFKTVQLTKEGYHKFHLELEELKNQKRPKAIDTLHKARSMGDLSENSAYHSAREELALVEGRILEIEEILKLSIVVENNNHTDKVSLGSIITVESNGVKNQYKIVGEFEADPINKKLSSNSPLGAGFIGKKVGDIIEIKIPSGTIVYKILKIS